MILVRPATTRDWHAVGSLVLESVQEAPSSPFGYEDLPADPLLLGRQIIRIGDEAMAASLIAETHLGLTGLAQVVYGEFARCSHSGLLSLLVHPAARNQGVGRRLLRETIAYLATSDTVQKLTIHVAETDEELLHLVGSEHWRLERVCPEALDLGRRVVNLQHFAIDLSVLDG